MEISRSQSDAAREEFRALLSRKTRESDWQTFFADHPYVLSSSLPLRLEASDILPLGRAGKTEPDFFFYPKKLRPVPFYGVVELKRPESRILRVTRKNVILLTQDAQTAIEQATQYARDAYELVPYVRPDRQLFLGTRSFLFVIMGLSTEIATKLGHKLHLDRLQEKLPGNLQLIPYDELLRRFESQVPPVVQFLMPLRDEDAISVRLDRILESIARGFYHKLECDCVTVYGYDEASGKFLYPPVMFGVRMPDRAQQLVDIPPQSLVRRFLVSDRIVSINDTKVDDTFRNSRFTLRESVESCAAIPLRNSRRNMGIVFANFRRRHEFTPEQLTLMERLAANGGAAISSRQLFET